MFRIKICIILIFLLIGCSLQPSSQRSNTSAGELKGNRPPTSAMSVNNVSPPEQGPLPAKEPASKVTPVVPEKNESIKPEKQLPATAESSLKVNALPQGKVESIKPEKKVLPPAESSPKKTPSLSNKNELSKPSPKPNSSQPQIPEGKKESPEEAERDIMEEALVLLNESHNYWVKGDFEDALEMLDQAYAILLDTNGDPDIARQKDDLRLMISKRILTLYNSIQANAKGKRSEIPLTINADVEKEIRQFQTVEREFFISSYQRSAMYRPIILRELKKAGLPEELSWLPLVESGFKISALSPARALGLWQFIPSTGYKYGLNRDDWVDERMDMEKATRAAIDYMRELHTMFGDWLTVLAAYNCGEGRIIKTIASQHINYLDRFWDLYYKLPYETARYVPRFIATVLIIRDPQKYGIDLGAGKMSALSYEMVEINKSMRLQDIARKLEIPEETLNVLNAELRHRITPDKPYKLRVPTEVAAHIPRVIDEIPEADTPRESFRKKRGVAIRHKVRQGETIASIAAKYRTSVGAIRTANRLSKRGQLVVGRRLTVPIQSSAAVSTLAQKSGTILRHKVKKGDTLASIARKYGISGSEIKKNNHLENDKLKTGQMLRIEKGDVESNREQKKESRGDNKANVKLGTKPETDKATDAAPGKKYTVRKGDSLNRIASENNTTPDKLRQLNNLSNDVIYPGQVVQVR